MISYGSINATNAVLFLHGFTQSATDARKKIKETVHINDLCDTVFFFPKREWFSYPSEDSLMYNQSQLLETRKYIHQILNELYQLYRNVKLGGYSQGASVAIDAAYTYKKNIHVLSISGYMLQNYSARNNILVCIHGKHDSVIPLKFAINSYKNHTQDITVLTRTDHWDFWSHSDVKYVLHKFLSI